MEDHNFCTLYIELTYVCHYLSLPHILNIDIPYLLIPILINISFQIGVLVFSVMRTERFRDTEGMLSDIHLFLPYVSHIFQITLDHYIFC